MKLFILVFSLFSLSIAQIDSVREIIENAKWQVTITTGYDPAYTTISYPMGDVPINTGVCSDVIIRAFRNVSIDFQKLIHEDMASHFSLYPQKWGLKSTDSNIDHRRVPNIQKYLERHKKQVPISKNGKDYLPGDIVTWKLPGNLDHIGLVSDVKVENRERYGIIHNIGNGAKLEDLLFSFPITGHYRYFAKRK
jgi:uncharacterized protein